MLLGREGLLSDMDNLAGRNIVWSSFDKQRKGLLSRILLGFSSIRLAELFSNSKGLVIGSLAGIDMAVESRYFALRRALIN
jgi:hypothetical protein